MLPSFATTPMTRSFLSSICLALLVLFATPSVRAASGDSGDAARFHVTALALLMPDALVGKRIAVSDIVSLTDAIVAEANVWSKDLDAARQVDDCTIFVAVRPRHRLKTWVSCSSFDGSALATHLAQAVDEKRIPTAKGLVLYAIHGKTADHEAFPEEWKAALDSKQSEVMMTSIVDKVWPE